MAREVANDDRGAGLVLDSSVFGEPEIESVELEQLAAVRAALDPKRRAARSDILVNAALELLSARGPLGEDALLDGLNKMWETSSLTAPQLQTALRDALAGCLVEKVTDLSGGEKWRASEVVVNESRQDQDWVRRTMDTFQEQVEERAGDVTAEWKPHAKNKLPHQLFQLLARGAQGSFVVADNAGGQLQPLIFDMDRVKAEIRKLNPKSVRQPLEELVIAAIDPADEFGNDIVHLLVVGNILRGVLTKRDLQVVPSLQGTRLLLDTSALIDLVMDDQAQQKVMENLIGLSLQLGVELVVADHTLEEWERVWSAAENEKPESFDRRQPTGATHQLAANPFVAEYLRLKAGRQALTWQRFAIDRRNISRRLNESGVHIRSAGNNTEADRLIYQGVFDALSEVDERGSRRTRSGADADAASCAMVARWRRKESASPSKDYFVAKDFWTNQAYQKVQNEDSTSLTVDPAAWLTYVGALTADDVNQVELAEMVSTAVVRESFLRLATQYTVEEVIELADMITANGHDVTAEDARIAIQLDMTELFDEESGNSGDTRAHVAGVRVVQNRSWRRDARARRSQAQSDAVQAENLYYAERAGNMEAELRARDEKIAALQTGQRKSSKTITTLKRAIPMAVVGVLLIGVLSLLIITDHLSGKLMWLSIFGSCFFVGNAVQFCGDTEKSWWQPAAVATVTAAVLAIDIVK